MAALTSRITLCGDDPHGPEDFLSTSLGVIFPDDVTNQHGDAEHSLVYTSPHLARPLSLDVAVPEGDDDRRLFSHFLWNASLLLAELVERDTLGLSVAGGEAVEKGDEEKEKEEKEEKKEEEVVDFGRGISFDTRGLRTLEIGAGTALPSIMAALLGAHEVVVTDYPAPAVMKTLRENLRRNVAPEFAPLSHAGSLVTGSVLVEGHAWGVLDDDFATTYHAAFDRMFVADCLWMPWQHANLRRSINHFLRPGPASRAWVVAGFHTGRPKMAAFFDEVALRDEAGVEVERIWERDCDGVERAWDPHREDDITVRKRWLVVAVLKRVSA